MLLYADANRLYGHSMSQPLAYDETKFDKNVILEDILNTLGDRDIGFFIEVDLTYPDKMKEKSKHFPIALGNKKTNPDNFITYMNKNKSKTYTQTKKLIGDWSDKKNDLIYYRMLKFYVTHGVVVEEDHEISFV